MKEQSFLNLGNQKLQGVLLGCVRLFVTPWTVACQASLPMEISRQGHWSGMPFLFSCSLSLGNFSQIPDLLLVFAFTFGISGLNVLLRHHNSIQAVFFKSL